MLRWLLPIIAAIAVLGSSVMSWAGAGVIGDASCCCPVKAKCKCHDHDKDPGGPPTLKQCKSEGKLVAPVTVPAVAAVPLELFVARPRITILPSEPSSVPEDRTIELETPPF